MKILIKLYCLAFTVFFAGNFFCRADGIPYCGDLINNTTKIEAVLLKYKTQSNARILVERTEHKVLNKGQINLVKNLFNNPKNYGQNNTDCIPSYGARLLFYTKSNQKLQIDFCFSCGFMAGALDGKKLHGKFDDFHAMRESLLKLFKEVFPKDSPYSASE